MKVMKSSLLSYIFILGVIFVSCDDETPVTNSLEGPWSWQSSCGGIVGCVYPNSKDYKTLRITDTLLELNESGKITMSGNYTINSVNGDDKSKTYEIELSDTTEWVIVIEDNFLSMQTLPVISVYKRNQ
jgi:hypothetical protein